MNRITHALTIGVMPLLLWTAAFAQDGNPPPQPLPPAPMNLFSPAALPQGATVLSQAKTSQPVLPEFGVLRSANPGTRIILNLGPGAEWIMLVTKVERRSPESFSVFGTIDGLEASSVVMAVEGDALASDITAPPVGLHYKTKYAANGVHFISEMDDSLYAPCGGAKPAALGIGGGEDFVPEAGELEGIDPLAPQPAPEGACAAPQVVFDMMIIYTNLARVAAGGTSAIQAECQLSIDRANESYRNSSIGARMRLVSRYEINYDEVGTYHDHLDRLTGTNDLGGAAPWTTARNNRDTNNADFCTVFVADGEFCGLAWLNSATNRAYSVVTWSCAAGDLTYAHEIGHNQGCHHDPANTDPTDNPAYSYSFGHRFFGTNNVQYRTVMAYAPGERVPHFSNPSVNYQGTATGTATRDNARTLQNRKVTCANFETTRWDIWVDFGYIGFEFGIHNFPYNSVGEGIANLDNWVAGASEYPNLYIKQGTSNFTGTINKVMTIIPCGGPVTLGN